VERRAAGAGAVGAVAGVELRAELHPVARRR
jgi:hypothetical protein